MQFTSETTQDGLSECLFSDGDITGVLWSPLGRVESRPLILLAHGGGQHKSAPPVLARAHYYVNTCGFMVAAIDAPGHGDRLKTDVDKELVATIRERMTNGQPALPEIKRYNTDVADRAVPDWQSTLASLQKLDDIDENAPVGFWGISMGTAIGIPFVAAEPEIDAAVFGLAGSDTLSDAARKISVPVEFLMQWDDELVPRDSALELFDAFASTEKSLHANAGRHLEVPRFEIESSSRFFTRHLTSSD